MLDTILLQKPYFIPSLHFNKYVFLFLCIDVFPPKLSVSTWLPCYVAKEEDSASLIEKDRRQEAIKAKVLRVQKDLEKALQDKTGCYRLHFPKVLETLYDRLND